MGVQARHVVRLFLLIPLVVLSSLAGCCSNKYAHDKCVPRSPWQSPTVNSMRSLLLVNTEELRIVLVDGSEVCPTFVADSGVREYHFVAGEHSITAVFRYQDSLFADVAGQPLTLTHDFLPGHAYVLVYREHEGDVPELEAGVAEVSSEVIGSPALYWSLDILDAADAGNIEPEVEQARSYNAWVTGISANLGQAEPEPVY
ncbi:MAG: hypothetical protein JXA57_04355 [Armatimonadetes bacterium]|nr:hypothetical protein [Armatimonadota bacterium]